MKKKELEQRLENLRKRLDTLEAKRHEDDIVTTKDNRPASIELFNEQYVHYGRYMRNKHLFFGLVDAIILDGEVYIKKTD